MRKRPVQLILGALALLGFLSIAMFWSAGMHQGSGHDCISATIQNEICPNAATPEAAVFHLNTMQSLTSNVIQAWQHFGVLLVLAWVALIGLTSLRHRLAPYLTLRRDDPDAPSLPREYRDWLSRLEHSPAFLSGRV